MIEVSMLINISEKAQSPNTTGSEMISSADSLLFLQFKNYFGNLYVTLESLGIF